MSLIYRDQLLSGWGRYAASHAAVARPERRHEIADALRSSGQAGVIARGGGLAYGDAAVNAGGRVVLLNRLNRFLAFDAGQGIVTCETGVTIAEILEVAVPRGWFPHVTPGTGRATVGGCLACDVHGKNHHRAGSFAQYVLNATMLLANGDIVTCGPKDKPELFWATCGGMGLTGIVLDATFRLRRIETDSIIARNIITHDLDETFRTVEATDHATYSVAWLDGTSAGSSLGRGIVMVGEHATMNDLPSERRDQPLATATTLSRSWPFAFPVPVLGVARVVATVNHAIYRRYAKHGEKPQLVTAAKYFFPLDALDNWNTLFGSRGFFEYQVLLPVDRAFDTVKQMLDLLHKAGIASFFTSLKRLGPGSPGQLSFPALGYAFSFDVPARGDDVLSLLDGCDRLTIAAGGRVYLAKDARLRGDAFAAMYPRHHEWREVARRYDPACAFSSSMSRRLGLT